ncbi:hypothetical protein [Nocardia sp. NPDC050406]|uniref:hypothetical protein n=1 Tax=Nocardia sp. NPDC050406 TaxID=3364318 RepID=UPI0037A36CAB
MLKSYKKVSRWYPALEPEHGDAAPDEAQAVAAFDDEDRAAGFPYYIRDEDVEVVPPVEESVFRRSQFSGRWSDWVTDRAPELRPRERPAELLTFPLDADADDEPTDRDDESGPRKPKFGKRGSKAAAAERDSEAEATAPAPRPAKRPGRRESSRGAETFATSDPLDDAERAAEAAAASAKFRRRRLVALAAVLIAVLLLALAGGVALYVLHSHGGTAQSMGTMVVDARTTTAGIPAG